MNGQTLQVNDKIGNPIEIAAVIVWQVTDTAKALFEVDNYNAYINIHSETAMVSNLLVDLCGAKNMSPIINAETLYN